MQSVPVPVPVALPSPVPVPSVFVVVEPPFLSVHWVSKVQTFSKQLEVKEHEALKEEIEDEEVLDRKKEELEEELENKNELELDEKLDIQVEELEELKSEDEEE